MSTLLDSTSEQLKGRKALVAWEKGAGSSKAWRRCDRITISDSRLLVVLRCSDQSFYKSPLWLPQAFIRSPTRQRHNDKKRVLVSMDRTRRLDKTFGPPLLDTEEDQQASEPHQSRRSLASVQVAEPADLGKTGLPSTFMRLILGNRAFPNGQLDRFLPEGLILRSHWLVSSFLRNDPHADVYIVADIHEQHESNAGLELHSFIAEHSGNWATYAKRKQIRMDRSDCCLDRFWYGERSMFVVRVPKPETPYRMQMEDFPKLKGVATRPKRQFQCASRLSNIPTYAVVLGTTNCDPQSPSLYQDLREKELRRVEQIKTKARAKKSKAQRDKRQNERQARRQAR